MNSTGSLERFVVTNGLLLIAVCTGITLAASIPGDINGDGIVDFQDFLILAGNFGKSGDPASSGLEPDTAPISVAPLNERGFPLAVGNRWTYQGVIINPDSSGTLQVRRLTTKWEVEGTEEMFGVSSYRVRIEQSFDENQSHEFNKEVQRLG